MFPFRFIMQKNGAFSRKMGQACLAFSSWHVTYAASMETFQRSRKYNLKTIGKNGL
jgi:hypothetical protein